MNTKPFTKLTLVSTIIQGKRKSVFVSAEYTTTTNRFGRTVTKAVVDRSVLENLTSNLSRGQTYTVG